MMMKRISLAFGLAVCLSASLALGQVNTMRGDYARVKVTATPQQFQAAANAGVALDHLIERSKTGFTGEFSAREVETFRSLGLSYEILLDDLEAFYAKRLAENSDLKATAGTPVNFNYGSMGSYLTWTEALSELNDMITLYPSLVSTIDTLGYSSEGRPIVMVKISDNPNTDEAEPEVLYDALHHAREPMSLMQMIYYMWYMLENYGTDQGATYLVNNREMYFVPVVNPDGYVYNQTTDPAGGGMWRKNRRSISPPEFGADLNRNYAKNFAFDDSGSSPDPASDTYRGPSAFSEPETQVMRDFCNSRQFKLALNYHSYGNLFIYPWGHAPASFTPDSALFVQYAQLMTEYNNYLYGTAEQTVGYYVNGDSDAWMYGEQVSKPKIMSMTPEVGNGGDGFWPPVPMIIPNCEDNLVQNLRAAWLAGDYINVEEQPHESYTGVNVWLPVNFTNLGLVTSAAVSAIFTSSDASILSINNTLTLGAMLSEEEKLDSFSLTLAAGIPVGTTITGVIETTFGGGYVMLDTVSFIYGTPTCFVSHDAEASGGWTGGWSRTTSRKYAGSYSYTDSPIGDYSANESNRYALSTSFNLAGYAAPKLKYMASWFLEAGWDYVQVLVSSNGGTTWDAAAGDYTHPGAGFFQPPGEPVYDGTQIAWVLEEVDLSAYAGFTNVKIAFNLESDGFAEFDGFYFDDLDICGYEIAASVDDAMAPNGSAYLYPNPSDGEVFLSIPSSEKCQVEILNLNGQLVATGQLFNQQSVDVSGLAKGIYGYRIVSDRGAISTGKLVID